MKEKTFYSIRPIKAQSAINAEKMLLNGETPFDEDNPICDKILTRLQLIWWLLFRQWN